MKITFQKTKTNFRKVYDINSQVSYGMTAVTKINGGMPPLLPKALSFRRKLVGNLYDFKIEIKIPF
jgi:hypothetical protein